MTQMETALNQTILLEVLDPSTPSSRPIILLSDLPIVESERRYLNTKLANN